MDKISSNQSTQYYVQVQDQLFSLAKEDLIEGTKAGKLPLNAWLYNPQNEDWEPLFLIEEFRSIHPGFQKKPKSKPSDAQAKAAKDLVKFVPPQKMDTAGNFSAGLTTSQEPIWFVVREKKKFGPYSASEIIRQLQTKELDPRSYAWKPGFSTWQSLATILEFSKDSMKRLVSTSPHIDILVKRKHLRAPYEVDVVAHDNNHAIEGKTMVIGEGGLFLSTTKTSHSIGSRLRLHFREGDAPSFNAVAEVVSVVRGENQGYCMRFVAISETDRRKIAKYVSEKK